ncbi:MAG: DUF11 domain-containing protein, partial [Anaerolineae bacterium]|nr:DUF11 domain-containing protein [Anaerolineae bacterium]
MIRGTRSKGSSGANHPILLGALAALLALGLLAARLVKPRLAPRADAFVLGISAAITPASVYTGDEVSYLITLENGAATRAEGVTLAHTLPPGFAYVAGSTEIAANRVVIARSEPQISGNTLRWAGLSAPSARASGVWGMHTFVQDRCERAYIGGQLDHVRRLMGPNAYVKQLLYRITIETQGPELCWVDFVNGCYDRDLIPVVRLAGPYGGPNWIKPPASAPGDYTGIAQAFARVVAGLPRRENRPLYVEIWNEPNLDIEWGGEANPTEYAHFLVDVAQAIRALGDARIRLLNGGLSPGGNYERLAFIDAMAQVPGAMQAFDVWAAHPYPGNHPPEYNIHDVSAPLYPELTIDSYLLELTRLAAYGREDVQVLLTETGYALGQNNFGFQGYAPIDEGNRADYIARALRDYWAQWPEVLGVCPFELVDPYGGWEVWDWLYPSGARHLQYDAVLGLDKTPALAEGELRLRFRARAAGSPGVYASDIRADSTNAGTVALSGAAPVSVKARPITLTPTATATPLGPPTPTPSPTPTPICFPALSNGGFETDEAWYIPDTAYPAGYSEAMAHSGRRSMRLGIVSDPSALSYSSANQPFQVPALASSVRISFWYYPVSEDTAHGRQYALLLDENREYLETILWTAEDAASWQWREHEVFGYAAETLYLHFGVQNDGEGGPSAMFVDDVEVQVC